MPKELKYSLLHEDGSLTSKKTYDIPDVHMPDLVFEALTKQADSPLFAEGSHGRVYSATEVKEMITNMALGLIDLGVEEGDMVFGFCPNSVYYACMSLAVPTIGAAFTACSYTHPKLDFQYQLQDGYSKVLLCSVKNIALAIEVADETKSVQSLVIMDKDANNNTVPAVTPGNKKIVKIDQLMNREKKTSDPCIPLKIKKPPSESIAYIYYSSGSTGPPKGVLRTHTNCVAYLFGAPEGSRFTGKSGGIIPCHSPIAHASGCFTTMASAYFGIMVAYNDGFRLETFLETVQARKATATYLAPAFIVIVAKNPEVVKKYDISSLKAVSTGGAPLPMSVVEDFLKITGVQRLFQAYGSSEGGMSTCVPLEVTDIKTVGAPAPLHRVKIVDRETGKVLGPNQVGELYDQSPDVSPGYLNKPEADRENFTEDRKWLKTGDAMFFDDDGLLYVVDRYKEVIKVDTQQVAPAELESLLLTHDAVEEAAVIGIPDEDHGEIPKAFVVPKDMNNLPSTKEIEDFVNNQVAAIKRILGGVHLVKSLPKISVGKYDRFALKKKSDSLTYL